MGVSLGSNISSLRAQRQLGKATAEVSTVYERLSSGQRINRASDDAAGLSIVSSLQARGRIYTQGIRNLNDGISLTNIADGAIDQLSGITIRLTELAEQAASGTYGVKQRKSLDAEAQALSKEFFRISKAAEFNGQQLLSGGFDSIALQAGVGTNAVLAAGVGGAIGTGDFSANGSLAGVGSSFSISNGDFNGDGILDLVSAEGNVAVHLGRGDGSFSAARSFSAGGSSYFVTNGDMNGDGVLDIVTADGGGNTVSVFLGDGKGSFAPGRSFAAGTAANSVVVGDFDGNGTMDLVSADYGSSTISVLLGSGNGNFAARVSYTPTLGVTPYSITTGDFNGDKSLDVVTSDLGGTVSVFLSNGNGTFGASIYSTSLLSTAFSITAGDFNGDGITDLASADYAQDTASVLLGLGDGSFGSAQAFSVDAHPFAIENGDFNGDGALDLITANYYSNTTNVLLGNGNGSFGAAVSYANIGGVKTADVTLGDFDGDGVLDFATAEAGVGTKSIYLGKTRDGVAPLLSFSLSTMADARQALPIFQRKREQLAVQRGEIGAFQSRIGVATNVLQASTENYAAAAGRIKDADIADESSKLVRTQILQQAASAVLAQSNQQPALALQLLS